MNLHKVSLQIADKSIPKKQEISTSQIKEILKITCGIFGQEIVEGKAEEVLRVCRQTYLRHFDNYDFHSIMSDAQTRLCKTNVRGT